MASGLRRSLTSPVSSPSTETFRLSSLSLMPEVEEFVFLTNRCLEALWYLDESIDGVNRCSDCLKSVSLGQFQVSFGLRDLPPNPSTFPLRNPPPRPCCSSCIGISLKIHSRKMNLMRGIDLKKIAGKMNIASGAELKVGMFALKKGTEKNMSLRKVANCGSRSTSSGVMS